MRGKGEGSITRVPADKTQPLKYWQVSVELRTVGGQRRRKVKRSKDKATAIRLLAELRKQVEEAGDIPTASPTVEQWFTHWLEVIAPREIRPKTLANYRSLSSKWIIPEIGRIKLEKLTPAHVRRVTENVIAHRSSSTALSVYRVLASSLADAERESTITRNPARKVKPPRKARTNLDVLTTAEAARFVNESIAANTGLLWVAYILTGARRGELLGLQWDRVTDVLDLSWQLQRFPVGEFKVPADYEYQQLTDTLYLTRPKSSAGQRTIPIVEPLYSQLARWRALSPTNPYNLVFVTGEGQPLDPDRVSKDWVKARRAAGITKNVRLHDLRHTTADLLYEAKAPEHIIIDILGHSNRAMSQAYRSRGVSAAHRDVMVRMNAIVAK